MFLLLVIYVTHIARTAGLSSQDSVLGTTDWYGPPENGPAAPGKAAGRLADPF